MQGGRRADAIDTRIVFWVYAALAGLAGVALLIWGPMWFGAAGVQAGTIRVYGSIVIAAGCFAAALAAVEDPVSRRRGLLWFAAGHMVVFSVVIVQHHADRDPGLWLAFALLDTAVLMLLFFWDPPAEGDLRAPLTTLFGGSSSTTERLRSRYEQQIRQAASQEERNRLARDLHDSIKQQIFVIQTAAATAEVRFDQDPSGAKQALNQVRSAAREAMTEMEVMLDQLRAAPLENTGLVEALRKQCEALGFRTGAQVEFKLGNLLPSGALAPGAQQAILRVVQEALSNIARHARARNVFVSLDSAGGRFELRVQDDGEGFDPNQAPRGIGIGNLRVRAEELGGEFELTSHPGGGTSVRFLIPYTVPTPGEHRRHVRYWGLALIVSISVFVLGRDPLILAVGLWAAIAFTRELVAWLRTRKRDEAAA